MSKKSDKLVTELMDACYLDGGHWGDPKGVTLAQGALTAYIAALHDRIASLYKGPAVACTEGTVHRFSGGPSTIQNLPRAASDAYMGHAGTTGGLQQHSIGELYPCIIAKVGDVWQVDHSSLGFLANGFNTQAAAVAWAKNFKEQDR